MLTCIETIFRFLELTAAVLTENWEDVALHYERFSNDQSLASRNEMFYWEFLDTDYIRDTEEAEIALPIPADTLPDDLNDLYFGEADDTVDKESDDWYENN